MSNAQERPAEGATFADHNVTAAFDGMEEARGAVAALERGGIEPGNVSLLGRMAEEAAEQADTRQRDLDVTADVGKRVAAGAAAGTAVGGTAGFLAGLAAFAIPGVGPVIGTGIWAATVSGAVAGGSVGGVVGGVAGLKESDAWELTYQHVQNGGVVVGVHSGKAEEVDRAEEILRRRDANWVRRFGPDGRIDDET